MNLVYGLAHHESFVAQWLEHLTSVWKVIGSIPVVDSRFFLSHTCHMLITLFLISSQSLKFTIFLYLSKEFPYDYMSFQLHHSTIQAKNFNDLVLGSAT